MKINGQSKLSWLPLVLACVLCCAINCFADDTEDPACEGDDCTGCENHAPQAKDLTSKHTVPGDCTSVSMETRGSGNSTLQWCFFNVSENLSCEFYWNDDSNSPKPKPRWQRGTIGVPSGCEQYINRCPQGGPDNFFPPAVQGALNEDLAKQFLTLCDCQPKGCSNGCSEEYISSNTKKSERNPTKPAVTPPTCEYKVTRRVIYKCLGSCKTEPEEPL